VLDNDMMELETFCVHMAALED